MNSMKIGITGLPGAGKTQALIKVIEMLEEEGLKVGGMITEPIIEDNHRTGFVVIDWKTKKKSVLAHVDIVSKFMVGKFGVDLSVLENVGVNALTEACEEADVIVIDEVGKMEVESDKFVAAVKSALDVEKPMLLTLHKKSRNPLLQDIRRRDDVRILEVTPINRNLLPYKIMKLMKGELL
jgi:nucleoside-triphosphatase